MACFRAPATRSALLARKCHPPIFQIISHSDDKRSTSHEKYPRHISHSDAIAGSAPSGFLRNPNFTSFLFSARGISTAVDGESENFNILNDVLVDSTTQALTTQASAINEIAIAAADSSFPVAALQHFIGAIHSFTGFNWWASIITTTLLIRSALVPISINTLRASSKLALIRPRLDEIKEEVQNNDVDPAAILEGQKKMKKLFKEHGVSPFSPLMGVLVQGPVFISFFLAISNMVEKVPSFKTGGAFWFVDLTTPDPFYVFPMLTAFSFWLTVECGSQEGLEGNAMAANMKKICRVLAVATVPFTMGFAKGIFCYWVTSNFFSLAYGLAMRQQKMKRLFDIPDVPTPTASKGETPGSSLTLISALKKAMAARTREIPPSTVPVEERSPPSSINHRLSALERQVSRRKRTKKR